MFGNLDDVIRGRMTLTMVAKGHVELLKIETQNFYKILRQYRRLYADFRKLTSVHTDYLTGGPVIEIEKLNQKDHKTENKPPLITHKFT